MAGEKCPGDTRRNWTPDALYEVECPSCGEALEFFKDDTTRRCPKCSAAVKNPHAGEVDESAAND